MKRIFLTLFFASYYFFMPFVMVNCGVADEQFTIDAGASESDSTDALDQCQKMEFLVDDCIDILQQEEERLQQDQSKISASATQVDDFTSCQTEETISSGSDETPSDDETDPSDDETAGEEASCEDVIADMVVSYQICSDLSSSEKFDECEDVEEVVDDAVRRCNNGSITITQDFCSTLTA